MNFESVQLTQVVSAHVPSYVYVIACGVLLVLLVLIVGLPHIFLRCKMWGARPSTFRLSQLPSIVKLALSLFLVGFCLVQLVAMITVYTQTMVEHQNASEYFHLIRVVKLLGLSHAHLFGYTAMFGIVGLMVCGTGLREYVKGVLGCGMMLSAMTDVVSWWLVKYFGSAFEIVTYGSGALFGGCFLVSIFFILKSLFCEGKV